MRLTHLLSKSVTISRMSTTSGDKMAMTTVTSSMSHIQPVDSYKSVLANGVFTKTYRIYMDGEENIQAGDRLRDADNNYYTVKSDGVSRRSFSNFDYLICICEKTK